MINQKNKKELENICTCFMDSTAATGFERSMRRWLARRYSCPNRGYHMIYAKRTSILEKQRIGGCLPFATTILPKNFFREPRNQMVNQNNDKIHLNLEMLLKGIKKDSSNTNISKGIRVIILYSHYRNGLGKWFPICRPCGKIGNFILINSLPIWISCTVSPSLHLNSNSNS